MLVELELDDPVIVNTFEDQLPVIPTGSPVTVAPVAPVVAYVIFTIGVLIHLVCEFVPIAELKLIVLLGETLIVPVRLTGIHPPKELTVYV